jgi:hypothetical protein
VELAFRPQRPRWGWIPDARKTVSLTKQRGEISALKEEILDLEYAIAAAPELFEKQRYELSVAMGAYREAYKSAMAPILERISDALDQICKFEKLLKNTRDLSGWGGNLAFTDISDVDVSQGQPTALLPVLKEFSLAFAAAQNENKPLYRSPAPPPLECRGPQQSVQDLVAWEADWLRRNSP